MDNQSPGSLDGVRPGGAVSTEERPPHPALQGFQMSEPTQPSQEPQQPASQSQFSASSIYPNMGKEHDGVDKPAWQAPINPSIETARPGPNLRAQEPTDDKPVAVVKVLSVRGVEYAMMSILLWIGAGSLITILVSLISGGASFESLAMPLSLLLVCVPGFAVLYLRLRADELDNPALRLDASKRRFSQITQILAFLTCFFNIVTVVYMIIGMAGGNEVPSIGKVLGSAAVVLLVAGGILYYYWVDEHKLIENK